MRASERATENYDIWRLIYGHLCYITSLHYFGKNYRLVLMRMI